MILPRWVVTGLQANAQENTKDTHTNTHTLSFSSSLQTSHSLLALMLLPRRVTKRLQENRRAQECSREPALPPFSSTDSSKRSPREKENKTQHTQITAGFLLHTPPPKKNNNLPAPPPPPRPILCASSSATPAHKIGEGEAQAKLQGRKVAAVPEGCQ